MLVPVLSVPEFSGFRTRKVNGWQKKQQGKALGIKKPHLQRAVFFAQIHIALPVAATHYLCVRKPGNRSNFLFSIRDMNVHEELFDFYNRVFEEKLEDKCVHSDFADYDDSFAKE